jgi:hypothetical protein
MNFLPPLKSCSLRLRLVGAGTQGALLPLFGALKEYSAMKIIYALSSPIII